MAETPDWVIARLFAVIALLAAGLTFDWGWSGCCFAWSIIAMGMTLWSINEHEGRP